MVQDLQQSLLMVEGTVPLMHHKMEVTEALVVVVLVLVLTVERVVMEEQQSFLVPL